MAGEILSCVIADATAIDPVSSIGASGSGWVAIVKLAGLTSLVGTIVPSALTLSVSDPGYDTSGNTTTVNRTLTGVAWVRRQYPNGTSKMISTDGTDLTVYIALDDIIYSGTTINSASIGSTFYTGATASSAATKTNNSTQAYRKPLFGWMNFQQERCAANSYAVEGVAFHRHARAGQQVACVKYYVTDGTNTSADVLVSSTTTSALQTKGNIAEVWAGTVDMSAQTQGAMSNVVAKVYPWIGNSGSVLDLASDGYTWPTSLPLTKLRVFCDRTGGYGGAFAYVDGTGAGTPQVSATAATAKANPYATIAAAAAAIRTWNNTNKSHNNYGGGTIRLIDNAGADKTYTMAAGFTNTPGLTHLVIEKDPASSAVVTITWSAQIQLPPLCLWRNLKVLVAPGASTGYAFLGYNAARDTLYLDNCDCDNTQAQQFVMWYSLTYFRNCTFTGGNTFAMTDLNLAMLLGCTGTGNSRPHNDFTAKFEVGNIFPVRQVMLDQTSGDGDHGRIIYNNRVNLVQLNKQTANTLNYGVAVVQNMAESVGTGVASAIHLFADGDLTTIDNVIDMHNTGVGERCSRMYNDASATKVVPNGVLKWGSSRFNVWDNYNIKSDPFNSGQGSVGNWAYAYGVSNVGNVSLFGNVSRIATSGPTNDGSDNYMGNAWLPSSEYNLFRTALGYTQAQIMAMFTNYTAAPQGSPALGGNYQPLATSTQLLNRVPAGMSVLAKDIAGNARKTDGTGAAGAYEYPSSVSVTMAANAQALAAASAALSKGVSLAGAALSVASATAGLSHSVPLAATATAQVTASGQIALTVNLGATALASALATAGIALSKPLAAAAAGQATGSAALDVTAGGSAVNLAANAAAVASAGATLSLAVNLSAAAVAQVTATATLGGSAALAAAAIANAQASSSLAVSKPLGGSAQGQATGGATLWLDLPLSAAAVSQAAAGGAISLTVNLSAAAVGNASASASLPMAVQLSASGASIATAGATLQVTGPIVGAASMVAREVAPRRSWTARL